VALHNDPTDPTLRRKLLPPPAEGKKFLPTTSHVEAASSSRIFVPIYHTQRRMSEDQEVNVFFFLNT